MTSSQVSLLIADTLAAEGGSSGVADLKGGAP
jgi:hypothetical protein